MVNTDTHTRFCVTLLKQDYEILSLKARELNLSVSAFASQIINEYLHQVNVSFEAENTPIGSGPMSPALLNEIINTALKEKNVDIPFTVKDMFSEKEWESMSRSEKAIAAKILASIERKHEELVKADSQNKTTIYKLKKEFMVIDEG